MGQFEKFITRTAPKPDRDYIKLVAALKDAMANTIFKTPLKFASRQDEDAFVEELNPNPN